MAQDALSILTTGTTKDKLAEIRGAIIDAIRAKCVSTLIKNNNYSGDPESGSVIFDRFKDAELNNYGTARTIAKVLLLKIAVKLFSISTLTKKSSKNSNSKMLPSVVSMAY